MAFCMNNKRRGGEKSLTVEEDISYGKEQLVRAKMPSYVYFIAGSEELTFKLSIYLIPRQC